MSKLKIVQVTAKDKQAGSCSIMNTASIAAALPKLSSITSQAQTTAATPSPMQ